MQYFFFSLVLQSVVNIFVFVIGSVASYEYLRHCHNKFGLPQNGSVMKNLDPPENGPPSPDIAKYLDPRSRCFEIFGLPVKFLASPLQTVNKLLKKLKIVKSQYYYVN